MFVLKCPPGSKFLAILMASLHFGCDLARDLHGLPRHVFNLKRYSKHKYFFSFLAHFYFAYTFFLSYCPSGPHGTPINSTGFSGLKTWVLKEGTYNSDLK